MKINPNFLLLFFGVLLIACKTKESEEVTPEPPEIVIPLSPNITPETMVELPDGLNEISGAIYNHQQSIFGHNDSGGEPKIFDISLTDKTINRSIEITNAINRDWEDLAQDDKYIYVADIGNNQGKRTDLRLYKVNKTDVASAPQVSAEVIDFHFSDQTDFSPRSTHNFNCEAVISFNDQLYLFSKNSEDFKTKCYTLPKTAGNHTAELKSEFNVEGLITAATVSSDKNVIALLGYNEVAPDVFDPFVWLFYDFEGDNFFSGKSRKLDFTFQGQMEAICFGENKNLYFAAETESGLDDQYVYYLDVDAYLKE